MYSWGNTAAKSVEDVANSVRDAAQQIIAAKFAQAIATILADSAIKFGILAPILAAGAVTAFHALWNNLIPSFGSGAFVKGDTLSIVGDHPQGEYIIPQPDFASIVHGLVGGGNDEKLMADIHMDNFRVWLERNNRKRFDTI
jgi:hypothetical protein